MRATHCLRIGLSAVAALAVACGKADAPADPQHEAVRHDHAGHAHEGHADGPGTHHEHGHPREALDVSSNPYVYEPRDAAAEPAVVPVGEPAGDMSFVGVTFEVVIDGRRETLALSDAVKAARPGPIANWDCNPRYGIVNVVDFAIAEDPARAGATFVMRVDAAKPDDMRAGTPTNARISIRRAGEPGLTTARGIATWDGGYKSGRAVAQTGLDYALEVRWRCDEKPAGP